MLIAVLPHDIVNVIFFDHAVAFATDPVVKAAFTPSADSFNWSDLKTHNIFIRVEQSKIEQLSPVITMLITQLVRYLERRPNKFTPEGRRIKPVLLLLDEFARLGKVDVIAGALATLRIKKVTIAIFLQSISQLDLLYGVHQRKVIMDNCSYLAVLSANDPDTQKYVSDRIGDHEVQKLTRNYTNVKGKRMYKGSSCSPQYEPKVRPAELSNPKNIKLITPGGFCEVKKKPYYEKEKAGLLSKIFNFAKKIVVGIREFFRQPKEANRYAHT